MLRAMLISAMENQKVSKTARYTIICALSCLPNTKSRKWMLAAKKLALKSQNAKVQSYLNFRVVISIQYKFSTSYRDHNPKTRSELLQIDVSRLIRILVHAAIA